MTMRDYDAELDDLKREVRELTGQLKKSGKQVTRKADEVSAQTKDYWNDHYEDLTAQWGEAKEKVKEYGDKAERYAKENPWKAAGMAAAAGFLAALMLDRGNRK